MGHGVPGSTTATPSSAAPLALLSADRSSSDAPIELGPAPHAVVAPTRSATAGMNAARVHLFDMGLIVPSTGVDAHGFRLQRPHMPLSGRPPLPVSGRQSDVTIQRRTA